MAMLILKLDGESLEFSAGGTILIGSEKGADVFIENPGVTPRHAEIAAGPEGDHWIRDLGSRRGTFVNGRRITRQKLCPGDELRFGPKRARFVGLHPPKDQTGPMTAAGATPPDELPLQSDLLAAVKTPPFPGPGVNQRRGNNLLRLFIILALTNAALFIACAAWFYAKTQGDLEKKLQSIAAAPPPPAPIASRPDPPVADKPSVETMDLKKQTETLRSLLSQLQKKQEASEKQSAGTARQLAELAEEIKNAAGRKESSPPPPAAATGGPPGPQDDLILIKERNRLTAYADEAIATGARGPYERLWDAIDDPQLANLVHAARAEILRVQDCFINGRRVKFYGIQQHQIPVAEIFPDAAALTPAQLGDDQLIQVLLDQKQSWQTRVKAAWHLGQRRSTKVGDALVKAIKSDPMLDVVAEATFSFEQITGYHAKLFDVAPLEAWWKSYNEKTPGPKTAPQPPKGDEGAGGKTKAP